MLTKEITEQEAAPLRISALPTRPTAPVAFGGKGYTALEMKEAFDKLPSLIIERFNTLIGDIVEGRILTAIPTELDGLENLHDLIEGISSGKLASKMCVLDTTLSLYLAALRDDVDRLLALHKEGAV